MTMPKSAAQRAAARNVPDYELNPNPDWPAIRRAYETGEETSIELGRRFGVTWQTIGNRARVHKWQRIAIAQASVPSMEAAFIALTRDMFAGLKSLAGRDRLLRAKAEEAESDPIKRLALLDRSAAACGRLLEMAEGFTRLLDRCAGRAAAMGGATTNAKDRYAEFERRLAGRLDAVRKAGGDEEPDAG